MSGLVYGNALELVHDLPKQSIQCHVTSPPYWGQRNYGDDPEHEVGWGEIDFYLEQLGIVLDGLHSALDTQGASFWVMGDKAAGSGGAGGDHNRGNNKAWIPGYGKVKADIPDGQWMMVPYRFAAMAQARGWLVRSIIVWDKSPNVKPEDPAHIRRPMISTERIIMLTKQVDCRWYPKQLVEPGDIWHIKPHRKKRPGEKKPERHQAPFPSEIPRRAILACTEHGMNVLDTFAGTGTTLHVASELGRVGHGFELYPPTAAT